MNLRRPGLPRIAAHIIAPLAAMSQMALLNRDPGVRRSAMPGAGAGPDHHQVWISNSTAMISRAGANTALVCASTSQLALDIVARSRFASSRANRVATAIAATETAKLRR